MMSVNLRHFSDKLKLKSLQANVQDFRRSRFRIRVVRSVPCDLPLTSVEVHIGRPSFGQTSVCRPGIFAGFEGFETCPKVSQHAAKQQMPRP